MTVLSDDDLETALRVLADEHNLYLFRNREKTWAVSSGYFERSGWADGSPGSNGYPTIREAVSAVVAALRADAVAAEKSADAAKVKARVRKRALAAIPV